MGRQCCSPDLPRAMKILAAGDMLLAGFLHSGFTDFTGRQAQVTRIQIVTSSSIRSIPIERPRPTVRHRPPQHRQTKCMSPPDVPPTRNRAQYVPPPPAPSPIQRSQAIPRRVEYRGTGPCCVSSRGGVGCGLDGARVWGSLSRGIPGRWALLSCWVSWGDDHLVLRESFHTPDYDRSRASQETPGRHLQGSGHNRHA